MKVRNVSGVDRLLGSRLVIAGQNVDVDEGEVYGLTCQESNWAPGDDEARKVHDRAARQDEEEPEPASPPAKNASRDDWAAYAVASGQATVTDVEGLSRDDLINHYGPQEG